ncbi:MAG: recombination protein NinB [Celeribacter sp.]|jgi:hypothetical protein
MANPTVILKTPAERQQAAAWVQNAPHATVVTFKKPGRTIPQNARLWAMLTEVSRQAMHMGHRKSPDLWKALFMNACGHASQFEMGLAGEPFPVGFRSSKMSKEQMSELIEFIMSWGAENGIHFRDEVPA